MIRRVLEIAIRGLLILLVGANLALLAIVTIERHMLNVAVSQYGAEDARVPDAQMLGFERDGAPLDLSQRRSRFVVRFASNNCPFSKGDDQWTVLASQLRARGVPMTVLLPNARDAFPEGSVIPRGVSQVAYISADWIRRYPLTLTPTLLVFDVNGRMVWHRAGTLSHTDVVAVLRLMDANKTEQPR